MSLIVESFEIFRREIYPGDESLMCSMHQDFGSLNGPHHNCLACNFADCTAWIHHHLHSALTDEDSPLEEFYTHYLLKLYLFVERAYIVFEIIGLPLEYRGRHFDIFKRVHKWANFIKHPKSFLLVHHAKYFMDGDTSAEEPFDRTKFGAVIDQVFILEYYAGPDKNAKLHAILSNKADVAVLFPNVRALTKEFCDALHAFVDLVRSNRVYREVLASKSTYDNYFEANESETES